ncbi:hypothetical protein [Nocardioides houyundeii]|uniref:hypothetical protein n=1 Tax=Nocardioides houyundeii TaxID=2045452 RepID=UPI00131587DC|nr:hypothetical protein [Nocardioides houyundeii]
MEPDIWYVLVPVALALAVGTWLTMMRPRIAVDTGARHQWAVVTATTLDGVTAHVQVEYSWQGPRTRNPEALAATVADAVEDRLRRLVTTRTVPALPGLGDDLGWEEEQLVPGVRVEHVTVTTAEVEVTTELRRLVQDRGTS